MRGVKEKKWREREVKANVRTEKRESDNLGVRVGKKGSAVPILIEMKACIYVFP